MAAVAKQRSATTTTNRFPGECFRCAVRIPENEGAFFKHPLRLVCAACALREGVTDDNGFAVRLASLPRTPQDGKELNLLPFQIPDCRRIATTRAILIGSQMGTGKTVQAAMGALRIDMPNLIFCPASVRENWQDEIRAWRPDLKVQTCTSQASFGPTFGALGRGRVLVCSFGVLPGNPCRGCRSLRARLKKLKKWKVDICPACDVDEEGEERQISIKVDKKCLDCGSETVRLPAPRYTAHWYPQCHHYPDSTGEPQDHPPFVDLTIDKKNLRLPYHPKGDLDAWLAKGKQLPKGPSPSYEALHPDLEHNGCWKPGENESGGCSQVNPFPVITQPTILLSDECHAFKNPTNDRTKNWRGMRERVWAAGGRVFGLSGTPCEGKPMEFWEVLRSLGLAKAAFGTWENYHRIFHKWFSNPKGSRVPPEGPLRVELHARLQRVQINRRRKDVLSQLPPRQEETIYVDINARTINEVNEAVHRMLATKRSWEDVQSAASHHGHPLLNPFEPRLEPDERTRRRLAYNDRVEYYFRERPWNEDEEIKEAVEQALTSKGSMPTIDQLSRIRAMLSKAKVHAVQEWIADREEEDEPVVLFSQHVSILKKIAQRPGWACFHGGLTAKKRSTLVKRFQSGAIERGLCVSIGAGGEGITLTRAAVCAEIDLSWNPAKNQQAESRLIRIGAEQHNDVAADKARELALSGECRACRIEDGGAVMPCPEHQARILVVRFVARHVVDELVIATLKEKESLLESLEWDEGEVE